MALFHGEVGFAIPTQTAPGVWEEVLTYRRYAGNVVHRRQRLELSGVVNDGLNMSQSISIVMDDYLLEPSHQVLIRTINWAGALWKISSVEIQGPRLVIDIGGLYHDAS